MQDIPRVAFLIIMDVFVVALLITMLSACVTLPANYRDRTGDFVSNIAATSSSMSTVSPATSRAPAASAAPVAVS